MRILEAMRNVLFNSITERLNNNIKTVFKRFYGFKTCRNFMIFRIAGKLILTTSLKK
nr:transposase [Methanolobus sp.]